MNRFGALVSATLCFSLAACRSGAVADSLDRPLIIVGETTVAVGDTIRLRVAGGYGAGNGTQPQYAWTASDPSIARASTFLVPNDQVVVTGVRAGEVTISVATSAVRSEWRLTVEDRRPVTSAVLGASVAGRLRQGIADGRIALALTAGDTVDLSVTADSGAELNALRIQSLDASLPLGGMLGSTRIALYGAVVVPRTGTYLVAVASDLTCGHGTCRGEGPFTLRSRRSAPIFNTVTGGTLIVASEGSLVMDTAWVQNVGNGALTVRTASTPGSWLRPDSASIVVQGPSPEATANDPRPVGAVAVTSTVDTRGLRPGTYADTVGLEAGDVWGPFFRAVNGADSRPSHGVRYVQLRVIDSTVRIVAPTTTLTYLAALPDGRMFGATRDVIYSVDPATGGTTQVFSIGAPGRSISRLVGGLDGRLYFGTVTASGDSIQRLDGATATGIFGWPDHSSGAFAVLADGTVYAIHASQFTRLSNGVAVPVAAFQPYYNAPSLAYNPTERAIYFSAGGLRRYDITTDVVETRATAAGAPDVAAIDAQGRLYLANTYSSSITVVDTQGRELDRIVPPCVGSVVIVGGTIYGACESSYFWRAPLR